MHTLYHHSMNAGSRYVRLLLAEYDQSSSLLEEKMWQRRPEFLTLNPSGTVPVMQLEGGTAVCGALVIGEYLDETVGALMRERRLMPENSVARAETRRLVEWFLIKFENEVNRHIVQQRVFKQLMRSFQANSAHEDAD